MKLLCDLHIHSKYARATSPRSDLPTLDKWARIKGVNVLGSGDFTHPVWFRDLSQKLEEAESGLYALKLQIQDTGYKIQDTKTRFLLSVEVSLIYSKGGKVRKIHHIICVPSLKEAKAVNNQLEKFGSLDSDGRPIFGMSSEKLAEIVFGTSEKAMLIPAHCLLPNTLIHTKSKFLTQIKDIQMGDFVYTHKNIWQRVTNVFRRPHKGNVYKIRPYYFREGLSTTPEHPFYVIRTVKSCCWNKGICKPAHKDYERCVEKFYKQYRPQWLCASKLQKGDVLIFPRFTDAYQNHASINVSELVTSPKANIANDKISLSGSRSFSINNFISVSRDFCRLVGYFLAEGHTNGRDAIGFTFRRDEYSYIEDVKTLIKKVWGLHQAPKVRIRGDSLELTFYSKILSETFGSLFYISTVHNASTKIMPEWMLGLPVEFQVELIKGWWRGDKGYTSSRILMNQLKITFLRLGIIPSIYVDKIEQYQARGKHFIQRREIHARHDNFCIIRLTFFQDPFYLLNEPEFSHFKNRSATKHGWIDENYIYLPIRDIEISNYEGMVYNLEVEKDNSYVSEFATIHNCWTPWFSIFGSKSGFDSIEECFEKWTPKIFAIETGLSSDAPMNWMVSKLDNVAITSYSDAHSPEKIMREATALDCELSYEGIYNAIKTRDPKKFLYTIEFFPEEGKYHYDGHRACQFSIPPEETKKFRGVCPRCGRPLTIGVLNRVWALADRETGEKPKIAIPFKNFIPLLEIIEQVKKSKGKATHELYSALVNTFGNEFTILEDATFDEIAKTAGEEIAKAIIDVRKGKVKIIPGYDGEYGKIELLGTPEVQKQRKLF